MIKKRITAILAGLLTISLTACSASGHPENSNQQKQTASAPAATPEVQEIEKEYYDEEFLDAFSKAIQERWKLSNSLEGKDTSLESYKECVQVELDILEDYREKKIEDSKLFEDKVVYFNALDAQMKAIQELIDDPNKNFDEWNKAGYKRYTVITDIYDNYDLKIDSKYMKIVNKCRNTVYLTNYGNESFWNMLNKMTVRTENGSTSFTITNDTQYTFRDIDIIVEVYVPNNGDYDYLGAADTITLGEWRSGDTTTIKVENSKIDSLVPSGKDPVFSLNWK